MRVAFAGTPEVALASLDAIAASPHEVVAVITRPDARAGRGRALVASPVAQRATDLGVPVLKPEHPAIPAFKQTLLHWTSTAVRWSPTARCCRARP